MLARIQKTNSGRLAFSHRVDSGGGVVVGVAAGHHEFVLLVKERETAAAAADLEVKSSC